MGIIFLSKPGALKARESQAHQPRQQMMRRGGLRLPARPEPLVDANTAKKLADPRFMVNSTSYLNRPADQRRDMDYFLRSMPHTIVPMYTIAEKDLP